ncbi:MAG: tetraacyldisaccharide 4'-kinase [Pseudomonadota bacterium]
MLGPRAGRYLEPLWYGNGDWRLWLLAPVAGLFAAVSAVRRAAYAAGALSVARLPIPVVVVGNLTVGGSGKSPLVSALAQELAAAGWRPGIVSRGYGGSTREQPVLVQAESAPASVGDEALMLKRATGLPVAVGQRRAAAARLLMDSANCDVVISDDGLQHYGLHRDVEIVVVDAEREFGNGWLLPAGPLRESRTRLSRADAVWFKHVERTGISVADPQRGPGFLLRARQLRALNGGESKPVDIFDGQQVAALTAIAHPEAFFSTLVAAGCVVRGCALPDHADIVSNDLDFAGDLPLLLTEKDAVKVDPRWRDDVWVVETSVELNAAAAAAWRDIVGRLEELRKPHAAC